MKEFFRVREGNEVPISIHIWVTLSTFKQLENFLKKSEKIEINLYDHFRTN